MVAIESRDGQVRIRTVRRAREHKGKGGMRGKRHLNTPDEILNAALTKERKSREFYAGLAERCPIEMVRELVEKLKDKENKHVKMVEEMIAALRLGRSPV